MHKLLLILTIPGLLFFNAKESSYSSFIESLHQNLIDEVSSLPETDKHVAEFVTHYGGGEYSQKFHAILPKDPSQINQHLNDLRRHIQETIGEITPKETPESLEWKNSATTTDALLADAQLASKAFKQMAINVSIHEPNLMIVFGDNDNLLIKSRKSLEEKIIRTQYAKKISKESATQIMNDAVRGTFIAENIHDLLTAVGVFKTEVAQLGWQVVFNNMWSETRNNGYVAIHAKIVIPLENNHQILAEMQFHFKSIFNGTEDSPKERQHVLYKLSPTLISEKDLVEYNLASSLIYASALEEIAISIDIPRTLTKTQKEILTHLDRPIATFAIDTKSAQAHQE